MAETLINERFQEEGTACPAVRSSQPPSLKACWRCQIPKTNSSGSTRSASPTCHSSASGAVTPTAWVSPYSCAYCDSLVRACCPTLPCRCLCCNGSDGNCGSTRPAGSSMPSGRKPGANICSNCGRTWVSSRLAWRTTGRLSLQRPSWPCRLTKASCWPAVS